MLCGFLKKIQLKKQVQSFQIQKNWVCLGQIWCTVNGQLMTYILCFQSLLRTEPKEFGLYAPTPAVHLTGIRFCQIKLL